MSDDSRPIGKRLLVSSAAITIGSQLFALTLYFIAQKIILSTLSKEENGVLFGVQRFCEFLIIILVEAGLTGLAQRYIVRDPENANLIIGTVAKLRFFLWCLATTILLIIGYCLQPDHLTEILLWSAYLLFAAKGGLMRQVVELRFRARSRFFVIQVLTLLDLVILLPLLLHNSHDSLHAKGILELFLISAIPGFIILFVLGKEWQSIARPFSLEYAKKIFIDVYPIVGAIVLLQINDKVDAFFLAGSHNAAQLGMYAAAFRVVTPFYTLAFAVSNSISPGLVAIQNTNPERSHKYNATILKYLIVLAGAISIVLSSSTALVIEILTQGKYADSHNHFFLFLWTAIPSIIIMYCLDINISLGTQKKNVLICGYLAITSIITNVFFTIPAASIGAVIARFIAVWSGAFFIIWLQREMYGIGIFYRLFAVAYLVAGVTYFLPNYLNFIAVIGISAILYVFLLFITKCISSEDLEYFHSVFSRFSILQRFSPVNKISR